MLVIIESPYAGDIPGNIAYAKRAVLDCLRRNEYPLASHLLFTRAGILDDLVPEERMLGINAGLKWAEKADKTVVYKDRGISKGMEYGILHAKSHNRPIEYRSIK